MKERYYSESDMTKLKNKYYLYIVKEKIKKNLKLLKKRRKIKNI